MKSIFPTDAHPMADAASAATERHGLVIRRRALAFRAAMAVLVAILAGAATRDPWLAPWLAVVLASGVLEDQLIRRGVEGRRLLAAQVLTAAAF